MPEADRRTYAEDATLYANMVAGGDVPACKLTVLAAQRHLDDLARSKAKDPDWPWVFDLAKAGRVCEFTELLPHVKGEWARRGETINPKSPVNTIGTLAIYSRNCGATIP